MYVDVTVNSAHAFAKGGTIDTNGHKLVLNNTLTVKKGTTVTVSGKVESTNSSNDNFTVEEGATLNLNVDEYKAHKSIVVNDGTTNVTNGIYTSVNVGTPLFVNNATGTLNITGAKVTATTSTNAVIENAGKVNLTSTNVNAKKASLLVVKAHKSVAKINSGTYYVLHVANSTLNALPSAEDEEVAAVVTIDGGTYNTEKAGLYFGSGEVLTINNATINTKDEAGVQLNASGTATITINNASITTNHGNAVAVLGSAKGALTINNGTFLAKDGGDSLYLGSGNQDMKYAINGGTFESKKSATAPAISVAASLLKGTVDKDGNQMVNEVVKGILAGGKYLNCIVAGLVTDSTGGTVDVTNQLVAKDHTVKEEDNYKVIVSTKAEDNKKPAAKPEEQAPNTYDAGLVYMGLALSRYGMCNITISSYC